MKKFLRGMAMFLPVIIFFMIQVGVAFVIFFAFGMMKAMQGSDVSADINEILQNPENLVLINVACQLISLVVMAIWYYIQFAGKKVRRVSRGFTKKSVVAMIFLGTGLQVLMGALVTLIGSAFPNLLEDYNKQMEANGLTELTPMVFISAVILAPIVEELIFRGLTLRLGERAFRRPIWFILIQALVFGAMHMIPLQVIYASLLGVVLGMVYLRYRSLYVCMFLHLVFNGSSFLISAITDSDDGIVSIIVLVVSFVFVILGMLFMYKFDKDMPGISNGYINKKNKNSDENTYNKDNNLSIE